VETLSRGILPPSLCLTGRDAEARALYEKALALQPDFPEALNNLGLLFGRAGEMDRAERYFRDALGRRPDYGEAANNLALVFVSKGQADAATALPSRETELNPALQYSYTMARPRVSVKALSQTGIHWESSTISANA
jgi:Flp pilus assembly protein TadD